MVFAESSPCPTAGRWSPKTEVSRHSGCMPS